ncbi:PBSX family phage terminase large subunit [Scatolibacter rhodanostii]|uniref:PBSX family phage terminase large subunit n=1 Tax=Scatolibacter rhodanostii TaxID=2014781 RepID=UPI000C06C15A|nr:PBSX family phage terminase large subunit [Scatolibacter rhodanostii]
MRMVPFSRKQMRVLSWWCKTSKQKDKLAVICDGAVRSGKTVCMGISFMMWAFASFDKRSFAICGKTIRGIRRNLIVDLIPILKEMGFTVTERLSQNMLELSMHGRTNRFYLFGGRDEASASLIQGVTLAGLLLDEVALMPRSFVEQAIARCSITGAKLWFNCNPEHPQHWFYREWVLKAGEKNALYLHFTMDDNPSLSAETKERYKNLFSGTFYERFVEGKWVAAEGLIYPFAAELACHVPDVAFAEYAVSCDYGTINPASFGLWGKHESTWYRIDEYYYASRETGTQRTDEEHYAQLDKLCEGRKISTVTVDPSAASFIQTIQRHGRFRVIPAKNTVVDGIRETSNALKSRKIKICRNCTDTIREFGLYRWQDDSTKDMPVKENDHAMDDIRYFVSTILAVEPPTNVFAFAVTRR